MDALARLISSVVDNVSLLETEKDRDLQKASPGDLK